MSANSPLGAALEYVQRVPVFPCRPDGPRRKHPHTPHGFYDATGDREIITKWWTTWPRALIGMPTGLKSGYVVLDIDVKDPEANGFDSLEDLGLSILPDTPMAHTASSGLHVYFDPGGRELKNSIGLIGPGLDVRGDGGYVIVPSPGSGYVWDPQWSFDTVKPVAAPQWLWPPQPSLPPHSGPIKPVTGLSPYGEAAINGA